jgi:uncharacterized membrane protein YkoI
MDRSTKIGAGIAAGATAVAAAAVIAFAAPSATSMANAANESPNPATSSSAAPNTDPGQGIRGGGSGETPLTGDDATKATAAAQKAVEGGTVLRVETDTDGTYEAHVRKTDGTEVVVKMDKDFNVTSVDTFAGGRGGHGGGPGETPLTGDDATKATAAAQKAVEGGTVLRVETDTDGTYEAHVRKTDGTEVEVKMDKDFNVTSVDTFTGGRGGHVGSGPDGATTNPSTSASSAA